MYFYPAWFFRESGSCLFASWGNVCDVERACVRDRWGSLCGVVVCVVAAISL